MSHKIFLLVTSLFLALALSFSMSTPVLAAPLANDNFADATAITSLPFSASVDSTDATSEAGEPFTCGFPIRTVWYSFTPTQDIGVRLDIVGVISGTITVYVSSGPAISDLAFFGCASQNNPVNLNVEAGKTYYLQVADFDQPGVLEFNLQQIFPPANDNFANAEVITSLPFNVSIDNTHATTELGEPFACASNRTVWYSFTPIQDMTVRVNILGDDAITVYVSSGPAISDLTSLRCVSPNSPVNLNIEAGKTYYLLVADSGQPGIMEFNLQQIFPPANDNFANATAITSLPFSASVDSTDTTTEPGEPSVCSLSMGTVWYSFTPTQDMAVQADILGAPSPGVVSIYLSSGPGISDLTFLQCASQNNPVNLNVDAGKTYYLQVDDSGQPGVLEFNLQQIFPPANDSFANAEIITSLPFNASVDNSEATSEPGESIFCGSGKTVWYSFTPTQDMAARLDMLGSPTLGAVSVYISSGPGISDLTFLMCASENNQVYFNFEAGKTYYLQVTDLGQAGILQFNLQDISVLVREVTIDIKPGRSPNRIELEKKICKDDDNLYVAILTTSNFDAQTVDVSSLKLGDPLLSGTARPVRSRIRDVNLDGTKDLALAFSLCDLVTNGALNASSSELVLTGRTLDGVNISGRDSVIVKADDERFRRVPVFIYPVDGQTLDY